MIKSLKQGFNLKLGLMSQNYFISFYLMFWWRTLCQPGLNVYFCVLLEVIVGLIWFQTLCDFCCALLNTWFWSLGDLCCVIAHSFSICHMVLGHVLMCVFGINYTQGVLQLEAAVVGFVKEVFQLWRYNTWISLATLFNKLQIKAISLHLNIL